MHRTSDVDPTRLDDALIRSGSWHEYLNDGWMPICRRDDGTIEIGFTAQADADRLSEQLADRFGAPVTPVELDPWSMRHVLMDICRDAVAADAVNELHDRNPLLSAREVLTRRQKIGAVIIAIALIASAVIWPLPTAIAALAITSLVFLAGTAFKFAVAIQGARYDVVERISAAQVAQLRDDDLPVYSVLVPVFKEANIVAQLIANLGNLDYPVHKLEVIILTEEEDNETREAISAADPPAHFHVVTVPEGQPQTKPRACNVGLAVATGDYLVIYDAEDTPDADQLKKALIAFQRGGETTVCVQASLNYFNASENILTRMFTLEYSYWFDYMLAGLDRLSLPIPLGGTSNHFRTESLEILGGWDPYNVTEDADLGIRASALGYQVGVINSTTMEEANNSIPNFIRQRSRWIKGYMQTTLVHARRPLALINEVGLRRFLAFALLIAGTPATFLCVLPFYLLTIASFIVPVSTINELFPAWVLWISLFNFLIGNAIMVYLSMMGPFKRATFHLIAWAMLNPVYWVLHSIAAYKALWQLLFRPHYWEKTHHGLTTVDAHGESIDA